MNYSIWLGPTNQAVPPELWEEFRERKLMKLWSLVFKKAGYGYHAVLVNGCGKERKEIQLGLILRGTGITESWDALPRNNAFVDGFATRLYAAEYMMKSQGYKQRR